MESIASKPENIPKCKIIKAKKRDWASHDVCWFALNSKTIIAYSTVAASNLIEALAGDNPIMTIAELHDAINYDLEAKKVLQAYIKSGFGNFIAWEHFGSSEIELNHIYNIDCLEGMKKIPDQSVNMIFADLPYDTTQNSWDCMINLEKLWEQYKRIIKKNGCIALWAQAPFSHVLACSNLKQYKYEWVIEKTKATGHLNAKKAPMKAHEDIIIFAELDDSPETIQIFYQKLPTYNPQMTEGHSPVHNYTKHTPDGSCYGVTKTGIRGGGSTKRYPRDVLRVKWDTQKFSLHPTEKPLDLCREMVRTYTNPGDLVLDNCCGSGTIPLAAMLEGRSYIGMDNGICQKTGKSWAKIATERINTYKEGSTI